MSDDAPADGKRRSTQRIAAHARRLPRWHKRILAIATVLTVGGVGWQAVNHLRQPPREPPVVQRSAGDGTTAEDRRGFVGGAQAPPRASSAEAAVDQPASRTPIWMTRVGGSFLLGFAIGFVFRTFLKLTASVTAVAALVLGGLSYFRVFNVDASAARERYDSASAWVQDQAGKLKGLATEHVPHSAAGFVGMFIGFRRK